MEEKDESLNICPHCGYVEGTAPKEIYHITPGEILHNKYIVGRVLGYGGFGITYIGWDYTLNRKVAIKEFLPSDFATRMPGETMVTVYNGEATVQFEAGLERFIEEAQRLAKFNSVGSIVDIYDTFIDNNTGYIVMECLEGDTVKDLLKKNGIMPFESAKLIIVEILKTLSVVHKEGIIHRDISPDNIFITNDNKIKLLDFGAARYASGFHSKSLSVILKPGYAPEEQYRSRGNQGPWSDVYATAATLYKMITGITIEESMERTVKDNVKSPKDLGVDIGDGANTAIMNALNVHAEKRTQSSEDFINELGSNEVVRIIDKTKKSDVGRIPLWLKITAASILSVAIILVSLFATGVIDIESIINPGTKADESTRVPYVINKIKDEGEKILSDEGFAMQITDQAYDEFAAKDIIKSQTPGSGKEAIDCTEYDDKGRPIVFVVVSGGHAPVIVPNVAGIMKDEAETILKKLGFEVSYEEEYSSDQPVGMVLLQDIVDVEYAYGSTIILTVSKGVMKVDASKSHAIPDLTGMDYDAAVKKLSAIGMYAKRVEKSNSAKENQVLEQSIAAGSSMPEGTTVILVVSTNTIVIPNVMYKEEAIAKQLILESGAKVKVVYEKNKQVKSGNVFKQSVTGKSVVGTTVTLTVSTGFEDEVKPQTTVKCSICGSKDHTDVNHPKCGICSSKDHVTATHPRCSKCGSIDHLTADHKEICSICGSTFHTTSGHPECKYCGSISHTSSEHPKCEYCRSVDHESSKHPKCKVCGSANHTTETRRECSTCGGCIGGNCECIDASVLIGQTLRNTYSGDMQKHARQLLRGYEDEIFITTSDISGRPGEIVDIIPKKINNKTTSRVMIYVTSNTIIE